MNKEANDALMQVVTLGLSTSREIRQKLIALEQTMKDRDPQLYDAYLDRLEKENQKDTSGMQMLAALERLRDALQLPE
jgi:hypothetical protein